MHSSAATTAATATRVYFYFQFSSAMQTEYKISIMSPEYRMQFQHERFQSISCRMECHKHHM